MFSSRFRIPEHLAYREYDGRFVVVVDWHLRRTHIVRGDAHLAWRTVTGGSTARGGSGPELRTGLAALVRRGLIVREAARENVEFSSEECATSGASALNVINEWAAKNFVPLNGSLEVTGKCNLRCNHCFSVHKENHGLTTSEVLSVVDQMAASGVLMLTLTGGEFFSRTDWREILRHLCDLRFSVRINTNGTLIDQRMAEELVAYPQLSHLHVSVYSADPLVHDGITGRAGSLRKTLAALQWLKRTGKGLRINCSVMRSNYASFYAVKTDVADTLGIPVRFDSRLVARDDGDTKNLDERLDDDQLRGYYSRMLDSELISARGILDPKQRESDGKVGLCSAGFSYFAVAADGMLYPCFQLRMPIGSLLKTDFRSLWKNSPVLGALRGSTLDSLYRCRTCELQTSCNLCVGMSHLEDGDLFGPSQECCRDARARKEFAANRGLTSS